MTERRRQFRLTTAQLSHLWALRKPGIDVDFLGTDIHSLPAVQTTGDEGRLGPVYVIAMNGSGRPPTGEVRQMTDDEVEEADPESLAHLAGLPWRGRNRP